MQKKNMLMQNPKQKYANAKCKQNKNTNAKCKTKIC